MHGINGKPSGTLLIRGTGLNAVDAAIAALEGGQYEHVVMASRRGLLHALRGPKQKYIPKFLTREKIDAEFPEGHIPLLRIVELLKQELESAYSAAGKPIPD
jgi:uncharacterized NAD(P)/FAD-binding protein YdhS